MAPKRALRRPAGAAVPRRRPAARVDEREPAKKLADLTVDKLKELSFIQLEDALYYGRGVSLAGQVVGLRMVDAQVYLDLKVSGTQDDALLRAVTSRPSRLIEVHVCYAGCGGDVTGEFLVHGRTFTTHGREHQEWYRNVEAVVPVEDPTDELRRLREAAAAVDGLPGERPLEGSPKEDEKDRKKSDKKRKKEEKEKREDRAREDSKKDEKGSDDEEEIGRKDLSGLFAGTGLDPEPKKRAKFMKRARRAGKSKKKKKKKKDSSDNSSSGSTSSSSQSSGGAEGAGLFNSEKKVRTLARKFPGALTAGSVAEARSKCLTSQGTMLSEDKKSLPALFTFFCRQHVVQNMSPPMSQETLTVALTLDYLLQGKAAAACDVLSQRLKALDALGRGSHWSVARQMELVQASPSGFAEETEGLEAARSAREEEKLRTLMTRNPGSKGGDYPGGGGKGRKGKDGKTSGKGKSEESKGKGGEQRREDNSQWQKKK